MKRKILAILAALLAVAMALPMGAMASNASTFSKLKLSGFKKYDTALPRRGVKKTAKQVNAMLNKINEKVPEMETPCI